MAGREHPQGSQEPLAAVPRIQGGELVWYSVLGSVAKQK